MPDTADDILIHKKQRGFYCPEAMGYTGDPALAGRFSAAHAQRMIDFDPDTYTSYRVAAAFVGAKEFLAINDRLALVIEADGSEVLYGHADHWERAATLSSLGVGAHAIRAMAEEIRTLRRLTVGHAELAASSLERDGLLVRTDIAPQKAATLPEPN